MASPHDLTAITVGLILCATVFMSYCLSRMREVGKGKTPPQALGGWPLFGHLPLLKGPKPSHITLGAMADRYGPIFAIRVGVHRGLVVSSSEMAKECFTTNDLALASRPNLLAAKHLGYNYAMFGLAPHGPFWREIRKIATVELLSNRRLEILKPIRISEVATFLKELHNHWTTKGNSDDPNSSLVSVEMKQRFSDLTLNKELKEFFNLIGLFVPGDAVPSLGWLDLGGYEKAMKKTAKELDGIVGEWLEEHKRKRALLNDEERKKEHDFMDVMLSVLDGPELGGFDADTINKATVLTLIAGGSDTTAVTLTWALSLLLNNSHVLKKAQDELDSHVGKNRAVNESDMSKLTYIQAIVKETLRLYPAAPLSAPHVFRKDCTVGGYHVAAGTRLITNLWKIQPTRRACPGTSFALQMVQFTLARFLQAFEIATPFDAPIDMTESFGLTNSKATPLEVVIMPRLPAQHYA
ncbi:hypothetical protein TIFTF001_052220 [Ficus carica]|uniref:Cytochrome P450 n=1 Tax=Ficus carica TaxID=3494 RepID=A0AA88EHZ8_FICCA|nr:hypothetical protein TIFTF001_052220 [Ficus carica]